MPNAFYDCYLTDPYGVKLGDASNFISLKHTRTTNDVSSATLVLPYKSNHFRTFNPLLIKAPDGRLEIWRRQQSTERVILATDTIWLIKKMDYDRDDRGRETIIIEADTPLSVLREPGRMVNYTTANANSSVTDSLDDAIKFVARTNIGSSADASRDLSAYISIAPDLGLAPSDSKSFAWRDCLKTMQELANTSAQQGVYLAFDIVAVYSDTLMELRTYTQQRGVDHRFPSGLNPVIISPDFGNMGECTLSYDWRNEITYAQAGGRGEGAARLLASAQDDTRIGASPFGLREKFVNATMYTTTTGLQAEAESVVRTGRPKTIFRGRILDVPGCRYGVHWGWGDYVTVQAFGLSFDARIEAVTVTVKDGKETIDAWVRGDL